MLTKRLVLVAVLVAGALTACGKGDVKPASSGQPTTSAPAEESTTSTSEAPVAEAAEISLTATEYAYQAEGELSVPAGAVTVNLQNDGAEEHQATIVRFKEGKGLADLAAVAESDPGAIDTVVDTFGGPNAVAPDGGSASSTQTLEAGEYVFMCFIPAPDGQPHAAKGMAAPFTVTEADTDATGGEEASGENAITAKEFAYDFEDGGTLPAGTYSLANDGEQLHEAAVYAPAEGKTVDDIKAYFASPTPPAGPPPFVPSGGVSATNPGTSVQFELVPGDYVVMCFLPDKDGTPHFAKGMLQTVTVE